MRLVTRTTCPQSYPAAPLDLGPAADQVADDELLQAGEALPCRALVHITDAWRIRFAQLEPCVEFLWLDETGGGWERFADTADIGTDFRFGSWVSFVRSDHPYYESEVPF